MRIAPKISELVKHTKRVLTSDVGKNEINAVVTPAMTIARTRDRYFGLSISVILLNFIKNQENPYVNHSKSID
jgi:hypothetical protein